MPSDEGVTGTLLQVGLECCRVVFVSSLGRFALDNRFDRKKEK